MKNGENVTKGQKEGNQRDTWDTWPWTVRLDHSIEYEERQVTMNDEGADNKGADEDNEEREQLLLSEKLLSKFSMTYEERPRTLSSR